MKKVLSLLLALTIVLALGACGDSKSDSEAESDLGYVPEKGKIIIGYTDYAPMNYTDESGTFTGFDTELATLVCEKLGVEPDFVEIDRKSVV